MLRAMYTSIGGLKNHQALLDTTANNIANVNTYGFKGSRTAFKDMLSQTMQGSSGPTGTMGGTNARQVGLGMQIDSITQLHTQGNIQTTGVVTDLAIQGDGYFRVTSDNTPATLLANTQPTYYQRAGNFTTDANGTLVTSDGYTVIGVADSLVTPGTPDFALQQAITINPALYRSMSIGQNGQVTAINTGTNALDTLGWITMSKFPNTSGLTQVGQNKWQESANSGNPAGSSAIAPTLGEVGTPGDTTGIGTIVSGALEMSNVDLATEFTEMIRAQRGFQANSRVITTSDEILQELVNLKR